MCPIRHYFTLNRNKNNSLIKLITKGKIVHKIYAKALEIKNFDFVDDAYIAKELKVSTLKKEELQQIYKHIHKSLIKKFPKKLFIESQIISTTDKLPHISSIVNIYNKPDLYYIQDNIATICEIKTGAYKKYDPLQLLYYSWSISLHNKHIENFVHKVIYTSVGKIDVVRLINKEELQTSIDRYFTSSCKAYKLLNIKSVTELSSSMSSLLSTDSNKLTSLFTIIHPEQCASCNSSIICPAYLREVTNTFENKVLNSTSSDKLVQCT